MPIPVMQLAFAQKYNVMVCVHFGGDKPVIYKGTGDAVQRIRLQCLAGVH